jgi:glutamyl-tRNA reductase
MSGPSVTVALRERFEAIRRAELQRLNKKLRGLTAAQRESVDAITAEITRAIAGVAERGLSVDDSQPSVEALVRLFRL